MHGPTCIFWANLTPFSLQARLQCHLSVLHKSILDDLRLTYSQLDKALFTIEGQIAQATGGEGELSHGQ
jgi:hypothetical protein